MGYHIRTTAEVAQWLENLRETDPGTAVLVDEALTVLRDEGGSLGPPLVVPVDVPARHTRPDLDHAYQGQLELLTRARRAVANMATARRRLNLQIQQLEHQVTKLGDQGAMAHQFGRDDLAAEARARQSAVVAEIAGLRDQYAHVRSEEERLTLTSQRLQDRVDVFRTRKEAIKAGEEAAEAAAEAAAVELAIEDFTADAGGSDLDRTVNQPSPGKPVGPSPLRLSELRPGAPRWSGVRILFTVEHSGTAAEQPGAAAEHPGAAAEYPGAAAEYPGAAVEHSRAAAEHPGAAAEHSRAAAEHPGAAAESRGTPVKSSATAVEPSATAVLLAAGTERDWLDAWYAAAIMQCQARYERDQDNAG